jgi:HEPN domain-containing protein
VSFLVAVLGKTLTPFYRRNKMKRLHTCIAALALGTLLVVLVGCDNVNIPSGGNQGGSGHQPDNVQGNVVQAQQTASELHARAIDDALRNFRESPESVRATTEAVEKTLKGMIAQLQKEYNEATSLDQMRGKLADTKVSRNRLNTAANKCLEDSEVALRRVARLEDEKETVIKQFSTLQEIARNAGLPNRNVATDADLAKRIQVGQTSYTGERLYRTLLDYRDKRDNIDANIKRNQAESEMYQKLAEMLRSSMTRLDDEITKMVHAIAENEMRVRVQDAQVGVAGLLTDKTDNFNDILTALQDDTDRMAAEQDRIGRGSEPNNMERDIRRATSPPMTDDPDGDLI